MKRSGNLDQEYQEEGGSKAKKKKAAKGDRDTDHSASVLDAVGSSPKYYLEKFARIQAELKRKLDHWLITGCMWSSLHYENGLN